MINPPEKLNIGSTSPALSTGLFLQSSNICLQDPLSLTALGVFAFMGHVPLARNFGMVMAEVTVLPQAWQVGWEQSDREAMHGG